MKNVSLTLRLAGLFVMVATAVLIGIAYLIQHGIGHHFAEQDFNEIHGKLSLLSNLTHKITTPSELSELPRKLEDALVGHEDLSVRVVVSGSVMYSNGRGIPPEGTIDLSASDALLVPSQLRSWENQGRSYRGVSLRLPFGDKSLPPAIVTIAIDTHHHQEFVSDFRKTLAGIVTIGALVMALLGWWVAHRGLSPLRQMTAVAQGISASRLAERISVTNVPAELKDLAEAFNAMLARLEDSFQRLTDFSSDLAHEMRTPISNLMTQTQVALSRERMAQEYEEVLHSSLEEYDRLARMVADMLFLAKTEHGLIIPQREEVDLAEETHELFEFYEALAEERGVALECRGGASVHGDRLMLRRALSNLLSNAIRFTPSGMAVIVALSSTSEGVTVTVQNPGPTIAKEHLSRLFDRFFRADRARQHSTDGVGLGLAITKSIVEAHGGTITVESANDLTAFAARLPTNVQLFADLATTRTAIAGS